MIQPRRTTTVAAVLDPHERSGAEAASVGCFDLLHRETVRDALRMVRERPVDAVLVSVGRVRGDSSALLEQFSRAFPAIPTVALMTRYSQTDAQALLTLGATGVRQVIDASNPAGWRKLREILGSHPTEHSPVILRPILNATGPLEHGARHFWEVLVRTAPETTTVRQLATALEVTPSTLISRFNRTGLPSPKDHLVAVRLCHAARTFDEGDHTIGDVAYRLGFASPQAFGRHLRAVLGITPSEFRNRFPFGVMLDRFIDRMVTPYVPVWQRFRPLAPGRTEREESISCKA